MKSSLTRQIHKIGFFFKKNAPTIMTVAGVAGGVTACVVACKKTLELENTLDNCKERMEDIKEAYVMDEEYTENNYKKDITKATIKNACEVGKLYAPAVLIGAASIALIFGSDSIQRRRYANMAAAYAALDGIYKKYRSNVKAYFGDAIDEQMRTGVHKEIVGVNQPDEKGNNKIVKEERNVLYEDEKPSEYSRFFDASCPDFEKDYPDLNKLFIESVEKHFTDILERRGYVFLNEVYKRLGMDESKAGQVVGWVYDDKNPAGDNRIDFGLTKVWNQNAMEGTEPVFLLDFNVDGDIVNSPYLKMWRF